MRNNNLLLIKVNRVKAGDPFDLQVEEVSLTQPHEQQ